MNLKLVREENLQRIKISASKQSKEFKDAQNFPKYLKTTIKPIIKKILSTTATTRATDVGDVCTAVTIESAAATGAPNTDTVPSSLHGVDDDGYNCTIQIDDDDDVQVVHTIKEFTSEEHTVSTQTLADNDRSDQTPDWPVEDDDADPVYIRQASS